MDADDSLPEFVKAALDRTFEALDPSDTIVGRLNAAGEVTEIRRYHRPRVVETTKERR